MDTATADFLLRTRLRTVIYDAQDGDLLADVHRAAVLRQEAADAEAAAVAAARRGGASWSEVGAALGISKQAAQQRYRAHD